jgi:hypothetical protein
MLNAAKKETRYPRFHPYPPHAIPLSYENVYMEINSILSVSNQNIIYV